MSSENMSSPSETARVLSNIYGSLVVLMAVMLFMSSLFGALPAEVTFHAFILAWAVGAFIIVMGTELARLLQKSGITPVGFFGFLILNLLLVSIFLGVFADIVVPSTIDTPILMVVYLIIGSAAWYVVLLLWMAYQWKKSR
ncbi:MAG: hypothetical protein ACP6KW_02565 [Candidatus Thorarchaeota archaeon]